MAHTARHIRQAYVVKKRITIFFRTTDVVEDLKYLFNIMIPDELYLQFKGMTTLQCYNHAKKLLGTPHLLRGKVHSIGTSTIKLEDETESYSRLPLLEIFHDGKVSQQLAGINHDDLVELNAILTNASFDHTGPHFSFSVRVVTLISTPRQRQQALQAELNARHERTKGRKSIAGVFIGIGVGLVLGLIVSFVIQLKGCYTFDAKKEEAAQKASQKPMIYIMAIADIIGAFVGYYTKESSKDP